MRLGLIARADSRGLGIQCRSIHDNLHPVKTMVVDCPSAKPLPLRRDWYPDATWVTGLPTRGDFRTWLKGLDVVYTAETAYGPHLWTEADLAGVKTVLHGNFEFLNRADRPTLWAAPSVWRIGEWPRGTQFLPVPIEPKCYETAGRTTARNFVHVVGRPAIHDRNGTADLLQALKYIQSTVTVTVRCQEAGYVSGLVHKLDIRTPNNVTFVVESGDVEDNADLYRGQDVLLMPRRFGGLCLPANEALGFGMPVVMPAISPNDSWLPSDWLVPATSADSFRAPGGRIEYFSVSPQTLAKKIDTLASDPGFYAKARTEALELRDQLSWDTLKPRYLEVLSGC